MKKSALPLLFSVLALLALALTLLWQRPASEPSTSENELPKKQADTSAQMTPVALKTTQKTARSEPLPDIDLRQKKSAAAAGRLEAVAELKRLVSGLSVDFDPVTGSPKWIGSNAALLTGPQKDLAARDKDAPVRAFIDANRKIFGHDARALESARRVTDYATERGPSRKVVWHQQHAGIDVFEAVLQANLTTEAALINIGSQFVPQAGLSAAPVPEPGLNVQQAVAAAGQNVGEKMTAESVRPIGPPSAQPDRRQQFRAAMLTDADAKLTWLPMNESSMRLAWDVTLTSRSRAEMYRVLVDAENGDVLVRQALTAYISDATYRVFTTESPTPMSPGHEKPSSLQPLPTNRVLVTTPALNTAASPNGWINDGDNITSGNNTDAYTDTNADDAADLPRTTGTSRVFDFPYDLTQEPSNFKDASVTQLFYWSNFMHDRMYELGFTEAAGNFQTDNFGRGGVGNDPVNSEAQDGSGTNNANFSTPVDGGRGRMQMYNWTNATPDRDGSFEAEVVLHEYGHGVSNRLVGGPSVTISALSTRGMGEGWSDFYGLALTAEASDNPHGNWSRGAWSRYLSSGWYSENYYYGARRYSYSTDMLKNPHTLRDIDPNQVDWHTSVPRNPTYAATQDATQVHYQGTVWCVALWDLRANLILKHGFAIGNDQALFLVTEGMKYGPANPSFIQSRDGILQATLVNHPGDLGEVWTAFAKRGMGDGATAPASTTTTGIVEQYDVPDSLEISDRSGWNIEGTKGGPFTPATKTLTLSNDGASTINWSSNPNASWLSVSPASGSLAPGANVTVTVTTQANAVEPGFHSTNLVFTNTGSNFNQPIGIRLYVTPPVAVSFDLGTDPGWTTSGQWAYGTPTGSGGSAAGGAGNADPTGGATGSSVFGVNLAGNAATAVGGPFYLTSTPVDLSTRKTTRLRFKRWLNTNVLSSTRATVEVSTNGTTWREVFVNPGTAITDNAWQTMEYDISSIADQQPAVQVRWSYQNVVAGTAYSGWNIDDVEFLGEPTAQFSIAAASTAAESDSPITATLNLNVAQDASVTVNLSSSNLAAATVPASLTLLAGETSKTFTITLVDDANLDGTQSAVITASAPFIGTGTHSLAVTDDETAVLTLTAPASAAEGSTGLSGSVSVSAAPTQNVTVLLSAASTRLLVPASVVIPSGSTGPVNFTFDAADNLLAEGPQNVVLTASVANWTPGTATVTVNDDESPAMVLTGPSSAREGDGPQTYTVTVNTVQATDRTLSLASSDPSELTVPASVVIPAGQFSANFDAAPQDDAVLDGVQNATLTASSAGFPDATRVVSIADNEVSAYTFAAIASPQKRNKPFDVVITARDINGAVITNHSGSVTLTSSSSGGVVPFSPGSVSGFVNGAATAAVNVTATATAMTLSAADAGGKTGLSNAFDVQPVTHDTFVFSGMPSSAFADTTFNATATAVDDVGTALTSYTDPTVVEILGSYFDRTVGSTSTTNGTLKLHNTAAHDSRTQIIYTAAELGAAPKLISAFSVSRLTTGGQAMLNYKVRLKHTTLDSFDGRSWEEDGWTTVYTTTSFTASGTFHTFNLKPFAYDGVRNLMVDISFDNTTASTAGTLRQTPATTNRMLSGTSNSTHGDPTTWTAASGPVPVISNELPTMLFNEARSLGAIPASPVAFTSGVWSGQAFSPQASIWLRATAPSGVTGLSNLIIISNPSTTVGTETVFTDGFEAGVLGASWSTAGNSGATARTQVTTANTPKTGAYHLTMDTTSSTTGTFAANRPTLTLNLAGRKNVSLEGTSGNLISPGEAFAGRIDKPCRRA
ncbi:MAG: M36 family metallopeptidase [Verrucomicrobiaceae bacterium]|nr:M36 family metallopeptidase [Verrucomicrobiaceae bacterium]